MNRLFSLVNLVLISLLLYSTFLILRYAPLNADAGAFLRAARHMSNGLVLYKDISCGYTPLGLLTFSAIFKLFGHNTSYWYLLTFIILFEILSSWLVLKLVVRFTNDFQLGLFAFIASMFAFFYFEGMYIVLEPFVVLFALLAVETIFRDGENRRRVFFAGCFGSIAFLYKQYGILILVPLLIYCILTNTESLSRFAIKLLILLTGFLLPICAALAVSWGRYGMSPTFLIGQLSGQHYISLPVPSAFWGDLLFWISPVLLALPAVLNTKDTLISPRKAATLLSCLMVFILPLYIRSYPHYVILFVPFIVILTLIGVSNIFRNGKLGVGLRVASALVIAGNFFVLTSSVFSLGLQFKSNDQRTRQINAAFEVDRLLHPNSPALVFANPALCYLSNNVVDPLLNYRIGVGCGFVDLVEPAEMRQIIDGVESIVVEPDDYERFLRIHRRMLEGGFDLGDYIRNNFLLVGTVQGRFEVWSRSSVTNKITRER